MIKRRKISIENIENEDITPSREMIMECKEKENIDIKQYYDICKSTSQSSTLSSQWIMKQNKLFSLSEDAIRTWQNSFGISPSIVRNGTIDKYKSMVLLHVAALKGNNNIINILMNEYNADVNVIDIWGRTPLHYACQENRVETCKLLVETYHADMNKKDGADKTPIEFALSTRDQKSIKNSLEYLLNYQPNDLNDNSTTSTISISSEDIDISNLNGIESEIYKSILGILIKWNNYTIAHSDYNKKLNELIKKISNKSSNEIDSIFEKIFVLLFPSDIISTPGCIFTFQFFSDNECYEDYINSPNVISLFTSVLNMFSIPSPSSKNSQSTTNIQKDNKKITNSESHFIPGSSVLDVNYYYICLLINDKDTSSSDYYIPNLIMKRITPPEEGNRFGSEHKLLNKIHQLLPITEKRSIKLLWGPFIKKEDGLIFKKSLFAKLPTPSITTNEDDMINYYNNIKEISKEIMTDKNARCYDGIDDAYPEDNTVVERKADPESIEVLFGKYKAYDNIGPWKGSPSCANKYSLPDNKGEIEIKEEEIAKSLNYE